MCCKSRGALSRLGLLWGLLALATLLIAFVSGSWLYTKEPVTLPNTQAITSISFRIGLWRVCPSVKRVNSSSLHNPSPACSLVKYAGWDELNPTDIGMWTSLELAQVFIARMRSCTILTGSAVILLLLASFFALLGHCNSDNKTIIACGFFILGGLSLGTGLVVFASALSETLMEITQYHKEPPSGPVYDYRYGWCFFTAGAAFIMTKMAAVFSLTGYLNRFPSVDEMVREMVPGAERKLREHQRLSSEYLVRHAGPPPRPQYDAATTDRPKYEAECGPLLNKTPPDVCTTNKCVEFAVTDLNTSALISGVIEQNYSGGGHSLAGQTIPITIKNHNSAAPLSFSPANKYGTMPHPGTTLHQGFLGVSEVGSSSSNSSSGYCSKSKTLQHQRPRKKCVKIETFQTPDTGFADFGKRSNTLSYSGSAV
ncbi:voltage-dependent calcium channel gamma-7 subunit-like [Tenebrio molitor]|uniref:voltage-dependent calcium channel gamma-7 subunit-like n=1 Tax=Tenebrio molitor TaxID=7067 RepID=UPI00362494B1